MSDIRSLLDNQDLSDVTFVVEGSPVYAHKVRSSQVFSIARIRGVESRGVGCRGVMSTISYFVRCCVVWSLEPTRVFRLLVTGPRRRCTSDLLPSARLCRPANSAVLTSLSPTYCPPSFWPLSPKALLAARCQHFRAMFTSGMRETHEQEVIIPHVRLPIFKILLEYIYADR